MFSLIILQRIKLRFIVLEVHINIFKKISQDLKIQEISDFTKFNEILDGRVKTLHPFIFSGILAKINNKVHQQQIKKIKVPNIDLVVVNLYPFEKVWKNKGSEHECIENIDIGGPSMIRAAAKISMVQQY